MTVSHDSLTRLLAEADSGAALLSGALCVYRVLPVLCWRAPEGLHHSLARLEAWEPEALPDRIGEVLGELRGGIDSDRFEDAAEELAETYSMASEMVLRYFEEGSGIAEWSDWCSTLGLDIRQQLDVLLEEGEEDAAPEFYPAGTFPDPTPLEEQELGDQITTLVLLARSAPEARQKVLKIAERGNLRVREALGRIEATAR